MRLPLVGRADVAALRQQRFDVVSSRDVVLGHVFLEMELDGVGREVQPVARVLGGQRGGRELHDLAPALLRDRGELGLCVEGQVHEAVELVLQQLAGVVGQLVVGDDGVRLLVLRDARDGVLETVALLDGGEHDFVGVVLAALGVLRAEKRGLPVHCDVDAAQLVADAVDQHREVRHRGVLFELDFAHHVLVL